MSIVVGVRIRARIPALVRAPRAGRPRVRLMDPADVAAAADVMTAAFGTSASNEPSRRRARHRIAHLLASDPEGAFVGERDGRIVGIAQAYRREGLWCLSMLAVDPDVQSDGMGRALFEHALDYGAGDAGLIVASNDSRALRLYAAAGFSIRPALEAQGMFEPVPLPRESRRVQVATAADLPGLAGISRAVRGAPHTPEVQFALDRGAELLVFEDRGFAVAERGMGVWLLAALDEPAASALLWRALDLAGDVERPVRWITAGQDWAVDVIVEAGLRIAAYGALCVRGDPGPLHPFLPSPSFA